jgi:phospholipid/cholesterol/gamma-HCH transport system permease protein
MFLVNALTHIGKYFLMLARMFTGMEKARVYWSATMREIISMGIGSLLIVLITSTFVGMVSTIQSAYQLLSALIPRSAIGSVVSATALLEFASTVTSLVLAGKIGSNIASELGTMRVSEQIDALDVMGINSVSYLVLPKILGALICFPILVIIAAFLMHAGGIFAGSAQGLITPAQFAMGARGNFTDFQFYFMLIKAVTYGLIISSVSAYYGYHVRGGALEVGVASTNAVVYSCIVVLFADYLLAQLLL